MSVDISSFVSDSIACHADIGEPYRGTRAQKAGIVDGYADATYDELAEEGEDFDAYVKRCAKELAYYL